MHIHINIHIQRGTQFMNKMHWDISSSQTIGIPSTLAMHLTHMNQQDEMLT